MSLHLYGLVALCLTSLLSLASSDRILKSLKDDTSINLWRENLGYGTSLFTILAGDCSMHKGDVQSLDIGQFVSFRGDNNVYEEIVRHLQTSCHENRTCDVQTIFVQNATQPSKEYIYEIYRSFAGTRTCATNDFGGLKVNCAKVWFVLSTCVGQAIDEQFISHESNPEEEHRVVMKIRSQIRRMWSGISIMTSFIKVVRQPSFKDAETRDNSLIVALGEAKRKRSTGHNKTSKITDVKMKAIVNNVDLSVFDTGSFSGQEFAVQAVKRALQGVQFGLKHSSNPVVFFFLGPAGTGKTMLSRLIASAYNGGEHVSVLEANGVYKFFSMAQCKSEQDVDSFLSPRAGLVGQGSIVDAFQKTLRPVIVLDEIEKAAPLLIESLLLSWIDENGFVQDKKDMKRYPTKDAVFILTSNCYSKDIALAAKKYGGDARKVSEEILALMAKGGSKDHVKACSIFEREDVRRRLKAGHAMAELSKYGFAVFLPPTQTQIEQVTEWFLLDYRNNHESKHTGKLFWTDAVVDYLKSLAKRVSSINNGVGGLSQVSAELSSEMTRVIRIAATQDCFRSGADTLLHVQRGRLSSHVFCNSENEGMATKTCVTELSCTDESRQIKPNEEADLPAAGERDSGNPELGSESLPAHCFPSSYDTVEALELEQLEEADISQEQHIVEDLSWFESWSDWLWKKAEEYNVTKWLNLALDLLWYLAMATCHVFLTFALAKFSPILAVIYAVSAAVTLFMFPHQVRMAVFWALKELLGALRFVYQIVQFLGPQWAFVAIIIIIYIWYSLPRRAQFIALLSVWCLSRLLQNATPSDPYFVLQATLLCAIGWTVYWTQRERIEPRLKRSFTSFANWLWGKSHQNSVHLRLVGQTERKEDK